MESIPSLSVLVIGDPHFKVKNVEDTNMMTRKITELVDTHKPQFVVCLGDVLDRHELIHVSPLERSVEFIHQLHLRAPTYVLVGNHDRPNNSNFLSTEHPFTALKEWNQTVIVDKGHMATIQQHKFLFLPYVYPGRFFEALSLLLGLDYAEAIKGLEDPTAIEQAGITLIEPHLKDVTAVFAHQEFRGAKMGAVISVVGDPWPSHWPMVISGHIHDYDELAPNITYTGTPFQHNFGDPEDKTVSVYSWSLSAGTWSLDSMGSISHQRISLGLPPKRIVYLTTTELASYVPPTDVRIKVVVKGSSSEIRAAVKLANIKTLQAQGVKIVFKDTTTLTANPSSTIDHRKYGQILYTVIQNEQPLKELYIRLFGQVQSR